MGHETGFLCKTCNVKHSSELELMKHFEQKHSKDGQFWLSDYDEMMRDKVTWDTAAIETFTYEKYSTPQHIQLPPGWSLGVDPASGENYYYNEAGESTWEFPQADS